MKTKVKTNSKEVKIAIRAHILESVTDENGETFLTFESAQEHLRAEFQRVALYPQVNRSYIKSNQERFHDYIMGIPFGFEYQSHAIAAFLDGLGINPDGKSYDAHKSARLYTYLIYKQIS